MNPHPILGQAISIVYINEIFSLNISIVPFIDRFRLRQTRSISNSRSMIVHPRISCFLNDESPEPKSFINLHWA